MASSSSCSRSSAMRASSSSMRRSEGPGLGRVAGGAVAPGQLVEPVEQRAGVADVAAHGTVGPPQPVGVEAQVEVDQLGHHLDLVAWDSAAPASARGSCGPRPPRGGGRSPRRRRRPGSWACPRRGRGRPGAAAGRGWSCPPPPRCGPARPCAGGSGPARGPGRAARGGTRRPGRCGPRTTAPPRGPGPSRSCPARPGSARPTRWPAGRGRPATASTSSGVGLQVEPAMNRAARSIRSGSSAKETSGSSGVRSRRAARSARPPNGSMSSSSGRRRAMALTVKSRRDRSSSTRSPKATSGLRESGR